MFCLVEDGVLWIEINGWTPADGKITSLFNLEEKRIGFSFEWQPNPWIYSQRPWKAVLSGPSAICVWSCSCYTMLGTVYFCPLMVPLRWSCHLPDNLSFGPLTNSQGHSPYVECCIPGYAFLQRLFWIPFLLTFNCQDFFIFGISIYFL